jgi:hypothetical protein
MRVALAIAAIASSFVAVPATAQPNPPPNCNERCEVVITMSAGCGSGIKVAPDPIVVAAGKSPEITWTIQNDAWAFDGSGIVVHQAGDAFDKGQLEGGRKLKIKHKNRRPATYKYDVMLKGPGGQCKLDPVIINE